MGTWAAREFLLLHDDFWLLLVGGVFACGGFFGTVEPIGCAHPYSIWQTGCRIFNMEALQKRCNAHPESTCAGFPFAQDAPTIPPRPQGSKATNTLRTLDF